MYLVVTNKRDLTADFIVLEMQSRSLPYLRLNTEDLPQATISCRPTTESWELALGDRIVDLSGVRGAYFRRPGLPQALSDFTAEARAYCVAEWSSAMQSLYWVIGDRWLNPPHQIALAEDKIRQLGMASSLGLRVPETLVTNDPDQAKLFSAGGGIIGKPLRNALFKGQSSDRVVFTRRIEIDADTDSDAIRAAPIILQREIPKQFDIRATVVGKKIFAVTIDSQRDPDTIVDWRRMSKSDLAHAVYDLPADVADRCIELTRKLGLRFAAIDLVLDPNGVLWFLEINPNGQWGWVEVRTGLPIAAAIVSELELIGASRTC